ncbi:sensor domain-containing diguanylate cyclase [Lederbergia citrea]|uniref:GGDEF domain-containing protein n=1 Tax=Lederbergia citrea TaxID=2833581 RepID=A0A942Z4K1_9BACI|nr:sensor domain-containing diguanylate cyclase [Lederbergia citrea]MBS4205824.1 GGDEF domain-containing protein [Lederbergia citrea]MBS4224728.1 GGDEF domain-containing protein [Lederbergia citrea]
MNVFISRNRLVLALIALISILDILHRKVLLYVGITSSGIWDLASDIGWSIAVIILVFWYFQIGKKIIHQANENEKHYRRLVELLPEAIIVHRDGQIIYTNQAGASLLGASSPTELLNHYRKDLIHSELGENLGLNNQVKVKRLDGTTFDMEVTATNIEYNGEPAIELIARDITNRKRQEDIVEKLVYQDTLTGLPNRRFFMDKMNQLVIQSRKNNNRFAVMFLDLDGFKQINDSLGHDAGDTLLKQVGNHLKGCVRENDIVARLAGDEFTILLPGATEKDCKLVAQRIIDRLNTPIFITGKKIRITTSIGIALYPQNGHDAEMLIKQADMAMYQAKEQGKNCYRFLKVS